MLQKRNESAQEWRIALSKRDQQQHTPDAKHTHICTNHNTHIHTHTHTPHMHACTHTQPHMHACMHTQTHHICMHTHTHHICMHTHTHHICRHTHTTYACTHTHTPHMHAHTNTHTHTCTSQVQKVFGGGGAGLLSPIHGQGLNLDPTDWIHCQPNILLCAWTQNSHRCQSWLLLHLFFKKLA